MVTTRIKGNQIFDGTIKSEDIDDALEKEFTKVRVTTGDASPDFLYSKIATSGSIQISVVGASGSAQTLVFSGTAGGSNTQVQYNDGGAFAGDVGLTFDKNTTTLNTVNLDIDATADLAWQLRDNSAGALNIGAGGNNYWTLNTGDNQERFGFWDGVRASFGDINDPDFNIQHDGTNSRIENKTGTLIISSSSGVDISGSVKFKNGLSGSLTRLIDGSSYLVAGTNITIVSQSNGSITISSTSSSTVAGSNQQIQFNDNGSFGASTNLTFNQNSATLSLTGSLGMKGDIIPDSDTTYTLGSETRRWQHIYTGDLHLKNERGDWTIIEEETFLSIRNNKTGKRFKFNMEPIPDLDEEIGKFSTGPSSKS